MSSQSPPIAECTKMLDHFLLPLDQETAAQSVRAAEDGWNTRYPRRILLAYTADSYWKKRSEFVSDRQEIVALLVRKWAKELGGRLIKELWARSGAKIVVRFACEWYDSAGNWTRSRRNENWEFDGNGLMKRRLACVNDFPIDEADRTMRWDRSGPRPAKTQI
jgi:nuclear transport factor 2 (NTF2) superfamily protein